MLACATPCSECEHFAGVLSSEDKALNFNTEEEAQNVTEIYTNALQCLSAEDQELSFIQSMLPMLRRGIGVHHSGLLPILKELVEILFQEQLIKVCPYIQVRCSLI
jgi:ATP-dependent RNA helicase DOB1